ncbi:cyclin-J-like isoform X1 [Harmonia axyridis]|uniref:cyclin-J-like isoform X1 n=1 Tax=Harmonia axyridis TaxID=115357 RepID=UPI001E276E2F|nr:cyclin-J-like isoform X1 [Harmonia axyridis]
MATYIKAVLAPNNTIVITPSKMASGGGEKAVEEYNDEFNKFTLSREKKRKQFRHQSQQFPYRKYLVDFIEQTCKSKGYSRSTLFLATYLLDLYMDHHSLLIRRLMIVAIASLTMAAKVEERSATVPKFLELMPEPVENALKYYSEIQKEMLKFFEWDLFIPTAAHHIAYFMQALVTVDEKNYYNFPNLTQCMGYVMGLYQDNLLKDVHLMQCTSPSKLAAALIASCRLRFGLSAWNNKLKHLSKYKESDFQETLTLVKQGTRLFSCINCYERFTYR